MHLYLDKMTFEQAWNADLAMSPAQVLLSAKDGFPSHEDDQIGKQEPTAPPQSSDITLGDLTPRQVEVIRLLGQRLSNAQIADSLILGPHTVNRHVQEIYNELGVSSRSAVTRDALEQNII